MGNVCKSAGLCCCFIPNKYQFDDDESRVSIKKYTSTKKSNSKSRKHNQISKSNIFTIYQDEIDRLSVTSSLMLNNSDTDYFKSSIRSLNEHRLISDLTDMNLTRISHQMTSFNINNNNNNSNNINSSSPSTQLEDYYTDCDSGFQSRSISPSSNSLDTVSIDSIDYYYSDLSQLSKQNLIATTSTILLNKLTSNNSSSSFLCTTIPFVFKTSLNESLNSFKKSILNSKFINYVKTKLITRDLNRSILDSTTTNCVTPTTSTKSSTRSKKNSIFYNTGINSFRQILLRIYDVNYF